MFRIILATVTCLQFLNVNAKLPNDTIMQISKIELDKRLKMGDHFEINVVEDLSYNKLIKNYPQLNGAIYFKRKHFYYSFNDDRIFSSADEKLDNWYAMSWSESLNELYSVKGKESISLNDKVKISFTLPRMNYVTNKPLLSKLDSITIKRYETKLKQLLSITSEIDACNNENIDLILKKINQKENKTDVFWSKIEIPLTIYFGEYFIKKIEASWNINTYFDDYGLEICVPYLTYQKGSVDLSRFFYTEFISKKIKDPDYEIDVNYLFKRINNFFSYL